LARFEVQIPFRNRSQPLDAEAISDLPRALDDREARAVTREILFEAATTGIETVGGVLDRLEAASPADRRRLVNSAREVAGFQTLDRIEGDREFELMQAALPRGRDEQGSIRVCAAPDCGAIPTDRFGAPMAVRDRRWWCPRHADYAGPDDHLSPDDLEPRIDPTTMGLLPSRAEEARLAAVEERRRRRFEEEKAARRAEAEQLDRIESQYRRTADLPPVAGLPQRRDHGD
jgi:hypothetical protein